MYLDELPTEIITHIFLSLPTIRTATALSAASHCFHAIYHSSKKLLILGEAADAEYGPFDEVVQLVTHNTSQPAHIYRSVPTSEALIQQVIKAGRVAVKWETIYQFKKWKDNYEARRVLNASERHIFRRAIYRLWLFTKAFHSSSHTRTVRALPEGRLERARLLHNFSTPELAEMLDTHNVLRDVLSNNVCPSNGTIRRRFQKRFPDGVTSSYPRINIHLNYPPSPSSFVPESLFYHSSHEAAKWQNIKAHTMRMHDSNAEGWGDEILHYYVVEDMLKLDPAQIMHLKETMTSKMQVEAYVYGLGDWFNNNGETFSETMQFVIRQRGLEWQEFRLAVEDGDAGVAVALR